jgi:hypothetical protein
MKQETKKLLDQAAEEEGQIDWATVLNSISNGHINPRDVNYIVEAAITRAIESAKPKWISVEDGLPPMLEKEPESKFVIALLSDGELEFCKYDYAVRAFIDKEGYWHDVTHWMPLHELTN